MAEKLRVVGAAVRETPGFEKVTGKAKFYNDIQLPGMLHGKMVRSPHACANIIDIDTSEAEAYPGVHLVMTYKNFPRQFFQSVFYVGMEVACVIAEDKSIAEKAARLVKVEYEPLPFVIDPEAAMQPGAPVVFGSAAKVAAFNQNKVWGDKNIITPENPNVLIYSNYKYWSERNAQGHFTKKTIGQANGDGFGDVEQGRRESDIVIEDEGFKFNKAHAPIMSNSGCVASYSDGYMTVYMPTQGPYYSRFFISMGLRIPENKVRVLSMYTGGAFGARLGNGCEPSFLGPSFVHVAGAASMKLGKPVSLFYSRDEEFLFYWGRGTFRGKAAIGFKNDGSMVMMDTDVWRNASTGGFIGMGTLEYDATATGCMTYSHTCKHNRLRKNSVFTNGPTYVGWQGFGNPEVFLPVEVAMDEAAEKLGIDPVELRRKNHMRQGDNYLSLAYEFSGPQYVARTGIEECLNVATEKVDWASRTPPSQKTGTLRHGKGMALALQQTGGEGMRSFAVVRLMADGTAILECNYQDFGQGGRTSQTQLCAETLGLPFEKVTIVSGDTNQPYTHIETCSSGTLVQGFATFNAAVEAKKKLLKQATRLLEVDDPAELDTTDGFVFAKTNPEVRLPWIAVFNSLGVMGPMLEIIGFGENRVGAGAMSGEQGATFVDLDVDTETGQLCNIKVTHAQDCGKAIFPKAVEGDWLGIHHGVEAVVGATQVLDPKTGKLLNDNWIDYPVATMLDSEVEPLIVEVFDPTHPYGAAGIAQSHQNGLAAAMSNAIYNAIGVRMKETPFTPDKILAALGKI